MMTFWNEIVKADLADVISDRWRGPRKDRVACQGSPAHVAFVRQRTCHPLWRLESLVHDVPEEAWNERAGPPGQRQIRFLDDEKDDDDNERYGFGLLGMLTDAHNGNASEVESGAA